MEYWECYVGIISKWKWWADRAHLELWQIGMGLNGDNLESHIHHWIVCCCWRTSWFQLIFIDTKKRDDDMNHLLLLNWLFQWDGHKTGIVIAIDGDVCQTVSINDKYVLPDSISHFTFGRNDLDELVIKLMNKHGYSINNDDEGSVMMDLIIIQRWRRNMKYQMNKPVSLRMNDMIVQSVFSEIDCLELMGLIN